MGGGRGWLWVPAFLGLAILSAVPAAALDAEVRWGLEDAPSVTTLEATEVSQDGAILRGSLDELGGGPSVQVSFEWGPSPALGQETAPQTLSAPATFAATLGELTAGKSYYYRAKAAGNGTAVGDTLTFDTAPPAFAGDLFSQLWLWVVLAAIAAVMGFLLTRKQLAALLRRGKAGADAQTPGRAKKTRGGLFAKAGSILGVASGAGAKAPTAEAGASLGVPTSSEILCPHCGTQLEGGAVYCYGCGRGLTEGADLEGRLEHAKGALVANERDRDALFTVGAHLAASGEAQEAIEILNKLTMLDPRYPGLWWVKARVFETLGNTQAAEAAMVRAMQDEGGAGVGALLTAAGQIATGAAATVPGPAPAAPEGEESEETPEDEGPGKTCPHCSAPLERETGNCPSCGRSVLDRGEALEAKVTRALASLDLDENDTDALFTLGAYLLMDGKAQESLDTLNRLTLLDPTYPGLWWVKAQVFEKLGNKRAAESALARAQQGDQDLEGTDQ